MYKFFTHFPLVIIVICTIYTNSLAVIAVDSVQLNQTYESNSTRLDLSKESLEKLLGRKLTLSEKLVFPIIKNKVKKGLEAEVALEEAKTDGMAIAGFVTGLVSLFIFGIVLGILGIIFSSIALSRIRKEPTKRKGKGLAIAGLVLGIVGFIGWFIAILILFG